ADARDRELARGSFRQCALQQECIVLVVFDEQDADRFLRRASPLAHPDSYAGKLVASEAVRCAVSARALVALRGCRVAYGLRLRQGGLGHFGRRRMTVALHRVENFATVLELPAGAHPLSPFQPVFDSCNVRHVVAEMFGLLRLGEARASEEARPVPASIVAAPILPALPFEHAARV